MRPQISNNRFGHLNTLLNAFANWKGTAVCAAAPLLAIPALQTEHRDRPNATIRES